MLADLIARVEAAAGSDMALDLEIARLVNPQLAGKPDMPGWPGFVDMGGGVMWEVRDYTGSLDVALTLVPEGCDWSCSSAYEGTAFASVVSVVGPFPRAEGFARCATPALALCAAALRAREAGR